MSGAAAFRRAPGAPPRIYGHRGARAHAPENTLAAFERAADEGADGIELDVRVTADGQVLVLHDPTFARVSGERDGRAAADLPWDEARRIDVGGGSGPPRLDEVLRFARSRRLLVHVEMKHDVPSRRRVVLATADVLGAFADVATMVSCFDPRMLAWLALVRPKVPRALLVSPEPRYRPIEHLAGGLGVAAVHLERTLLSAARVARHRAAGRLVNVWTILAAEEARDLAALGVDGLLCDDPGAMREALGARGRMAP